MPDGGAFGSSCAWRAHGLCVDQEYNGCIRALRPEYVDGEADGLVGERGGAVAFNEWR